MSNFIENSQNTFSGAPLNGAFNSAEKGGKVSE